MYSAAEFTFVSVPETTFEGGLEPIVNPETAATQ